MSSVEKQRSQRPPIGVSDVARRAKVSIYTVHSWIRDKKLVPITQLESSKAYLLDPDDVDRFLTEREEAKR